MFYFDYIVVCKLRASNAIADSLYITVSKRFSEIKIYFLYQHVYLLLGFLTGFSMLLYYFNTSFDKTNLSG